MQRLCEESNHDLLGRHKEPNRSKYRSQSKAIYAPFEQVCYACVSPVGNQKCDENCRTMTAKTILVVLCLDSAKALEYE